MQSTFYTIYQTTNLINNKVYIGKHITSDLNDGYLGSGKYLKRAIARYGIENFRKDILFVFDNEADMNAKEAELVTAEFVLQETNYNLCVGGQGGFSYINTNLPNGMTGKRQSDIQRQAAREHMSMMNTNTEWRREVSSKAGKASPGFSGRKHTEETKHKMRESARITSSGNQNSQYGTLWITNGYENKKIRKDIIIPDGWYAGRKTSST